MYPRNFLCEETKIKQHTSSKKKLCEIGEEAIWESRFTCLFLFVIPPLWRLPCTHSYPLSFFLPFLPFFLFLYSGQNFCLQLADAQVKKIVFSWYYCVQCSARQGSDLPSRPIFFLGSPAASIMTSNSHCFCYT